MVSTVAPLFVTYRLTHQIEHLRLLFPGGGIPSGFLHLLPAGPPMQQRIHSRLPPLRRRPPLLTRLRTLRRTRGCCEVPSGKSSDSKVLILCSLTPRVAAGCRADQESVPFGGHVPSVSFCFCVNWSPERDRQNPREVLQPGGPFRCTAPPAGDRARSFGQLSGDLPLRNAPHQTSE